MIYLESFHFPSRDEDEDFFNVRSKTFKTKNFRTCYTTQYPFGMFRYRELPANFEFDDITVFCGNNGSGKSTILNVIAEKLELKRTAPYNRSDFFEDYTELCSFRQKAKLSADSSIITSDDVFDRVLDIRRINNGIDDKREDLLREWLEINRSNADTNLNGIDDYERWSKVRLAKSKNVSQSQYLRKQLVRNAEERSNGESALSLFVDGIKDNALYLLDEPENSLSPSNQVQLKYFIEDCARHHGCQFIISTHSPFLLSLRYAKIYDIDETPVITKAWTELECVKVYYDFFSDCKEAFEE